MTSAGAFRMAEGGIGVAIEMEDLGLITSDITGHASELATGASSLDADS